MVGTTAKRIKERESERGGEREKEGGGGGEINLEWTTCCVETKR